MPRGESQALGNVILTPLEDTPICIRFVPEFGNRGREKLVLRNMYLSGTLSWFVPQWSRCQVTRTPRGHCPELYPASPPLVYGSMLLSFQMRVSSFQTLKKALVYERKRFPGIKVLFTQSWRALGRARELPQAFCLFWLSKDLLLAGSAQSVNKILK